MADAPNIVQLLTDLANPENTDLLRRFYDEPRDVMGERGLTPEEQLAVLSGNLDLLRATLDSASIDAGYVLESSVAIVATYTPPAPQRMVGTF